MSALDLIQAPGEIAQRLSMKLDEAHREGNLTADTLRDAVATINVWTGKSVGFEFVQRFPDALERAVDSDERLSFWRDLLEVPDVARLFSNSSLLQQLGDTNATILMQEVFALHPMPGCSWIRTARNAGVAIEDVKDVILAQLKDTELFDDASVQEFARSLVLTGAGHVHESNLYWSERGGRQLLHANDNQSVWWALRFDRDHDWLFDILMLCAQRCPQAFFAPHDATSYSVFEKLTCLEPEVAMFSAHRRPEPYFTVQQAVALTVEAASYLTSLVDLCPVALGNLPVGSKREIAQRDLPGSLAFVVRTAIKDTYARGDIVGHILPCFPTDGLEILEIYRDLYSDLHGVYAKDDKFVQLIAYYFQEALRFKGYPVGVLQVEKSASYGTSCLIRVTDPETNQTIRYIRRDRPPQGCTSKRYLEGTLVFVDTRQACNQPKRPDAHTVMVVFTAVDRDTEERTR